MTLENPQAERLLSEISEAVERANGSRSNPSPRIFGVPQPPQSPGLPAAPLPDPQRVLALSKQAADDVRQYVVAQLDEVIAAAESAKHTIDAAHAAATEHYEIYVQTAVTALETAQALKKNIDEITRRATK